MQGERRGEEGPLQDGRAAGAGLAPCLRAVVSSRAALESDRGLAAPPTWPQPCHSAGPPASPQAVASSPPPGSSKVPLPFSLCLAGCQCVCGTSYPHVPSAAPVLSLTFVSSDDSFCRRQQASHHTSALNTHRVLFIRVLLAFGAGRFSNWGQGLFGALQDI